MTSKNTRQDVNADKLKYIIMFPEQNAGRSYNMKIGSSPFQRVVDFKSLGTRLTCQNYIQEVIKTRVNSWIVCYHSVHSLFHPVCYVKI